MEGNVVQAESTSQEKFLVLLREIDSQVLAMIDQVPGVLLNRSKNNRRVPITPDYLVITTAGACLLECKPAAKLGQLIEAEPKRFCLSGALPKDLKVSEFEEETGISLYYISTPEDAFILHSNLEVLHGVRKQGLRDVDSMYDYIMGSERLTLSSVTATFGPTALNSLRHLFVEGRIRLPVCTDYIERPYAFRVDQRYRFLSHVSDICLSSMVQGGTRLEDQLSPLSPLFSSNFSGYQSISLKAQLEAERRLLLVRSILDGKFAGRLTSTHYRYLEIALAAEAKGHSLLDALRPNFTGRGKGPRVSGDVEEIIDNRINSDYCSPAAPSIAEVHRAIRDDCKTAGLNPPSYWTVSERIKGIPIAELTAAREGDKRAKSRATRKSSKKPQTAFSGDASAFLRGQIDSTPLDLHLLSPITGERLPPCQYTALTDVGTKSLLSYVITVGVPNALAAVEACRQCLLRWGVLPATIAADSGGIFWSVALETMLASVGATKDERPLSQPQAGGEIIEGHFASLLNTVINSLPGNKQRDKFHRAVYKHEVSSQYAALDIYEFAALLESHFNLPAIQDPNTDLVLPPLAKESPFGRRVASGSDLERFSMLPSARPHTVVENKGLRFNYDYFWHDEFRKPNLIGKKVDFYYDPMDSRTIKVVVPGGLLLCRNLSLRGFGLADAQHVGLYSMCRTIDQRKAALSVRTRERPSVILAANELQAKRELRDIREKEELVTPLDDEAPTIETILAALSKIPDYSIG